jgi:hypothetical protein
MVLAGVSGWLCGARIVDEALARRERLRRPDWPGLRRVLLQRLAQGLEEEIRVLLGEDERRAQLEDVVARAVGAGEDAALGQVSERRALELDQGAFPGRDPGAVDQYSALKRKGNVAEVWARCWARKPRRTSLPRPQVVATAAARRAICSWPRIQPERRTSLGAFG